VSRQGDVIDGCVHSCRIPHCRSRTHTQGAPNSVPPARRRGGQRPARAPQSVGNLAHIDCYRSPGSAGQLPLGVTTGRWPSPLKSTHYVRVAAIGLMLAKQYGLAARVWLDDGRRKARQQGKPVVDNAFLDSYSISLHDKAATYARMLRDLPPGLNEWAIHPAHGTEQWQTIEPTGWQIRHSDHAFLTSPQAREILDREGITVIDYRPLQQAWNGAVRGVQNRHAQRSPAGDTPPGSAGGRSRLEGVGQQTEHGLSRR